MIGANAAEERLLREGAIREAGELFDHHGDAAAEMLTARIHDPTLTATERRRCRLARVEVERLGRQRRNAHQAQALALWRPPLFSRAGLAALFGLRRRGGPGRRRRS